MGLARFEHTGAFFAVVQWPRFGLAPPFYNSTNLQTHDINAERPLLYNSLVYVGSALLKKLFSAILGAFVRNAP